MVFVFLRTNHLVLFSFSKISLKHSKDDKITLNGYLYKTSAGSGRRAKKTNYKGTITIVNENGSKLYHIDKLGWLQNPT